MIICRGWNPHTFKGKSSSELGVDYRVNRKAWMTKELSFGWLERLDRYIGRVVGRKTLLVVESCSVHGKK